MARLFIRIIVIVALSGLYPVIASAKSARVAAFTVDLTRDGAGILLRDLNREPDDAIAGIIAVIQEVRPDVLLLNRFDHDPAGRALSRFRAILATGNDAISYNYVFTAGVNAGEPSGYDLDGDGLLMGRGDALGWGRFPGNGGMAVLSRFPVDGDAARTFQKFSWHDLPDAGMPVDTNGQPWPGAREAEALRLSSRSHWDVPVELPDGSRIHLLASNPTPPLFDGPEGLNRKRNRDELKFWAQYLDGEAFPDDQGRTAPAPQDNVILLGGLNIDQFDGAGNPEGILSLLGHPRLQDTQPTGPGGARAANPEHRGVAAQDTADWRDGDGGPGNLRVDYVLPDAALEIAGSGVFWPAPGDPLSAEAASASAHRLVWVDVELP